MTKPAILIYGAGGHARVVRAAIAQEGKYDFQGFVVDDQAIIRDPQRLRAPIFRLSSLGSARAGQPRHFIVAIGNNAVRRSCSCLMESLGFEPTTVVHPYSNIADDVEIGRGAYIAAGAILDPDVRLGDGVIVNLHAAVGHDTTVGAFTHVGPGVLLGANSPVGEETFLGMGSIVISGFGVGSRVMVAAGALVSKNVPDDVLAIGSPARFRSREPSEPADAIA